MSYSILSIQLTNNQSYIDDPAVVSINYDYQDLLGNLKHQMLQHQGFSCVFYSSNRQMCQNYD